jgi:hypothetical protein
LAPFDILTVNINQPVIGAVAFELKKKTKIGHTGNRNLDLPNANRMFFQLNYMPD